MSKNAVMPMEDYVAACDKVREKAPRKTIVKNKTFYPTTDNNVTEIITKGTLKLGESYYVNYNNATMVTTSNIYEVRNIEVQGVSTKGIEMLLSHPAGDDYKTKICIYQDEENIMLYASEILTYEDYPTYITLEEITGKIVSGELSEKIDEVYEAGKNVERNVFWNSFQQNGTRYDYSRAFGGNGWIPDNFKPKYDIVSLRCDHMFNYTTRLNIDLAKTFEDLGIKFDTSGSQLFGEMFSFSAITRVPTIDVSKATSSYNMFTYSNVKKVDKFIINSNGSQMLSDTFWGAESLEEIVFEGVIGQNGLNLQWSKKLSKASWTNIMTKLSPSTTGLSITGSLASVKKAFETSEGANDGDTSDAWLTLCGRRDNWTISLV